MEIQITKTALKMMKKLDAPTRNRITAGINKLPMGDIKWLKGYSGYFRLRVGDYRVIYSYENNAIIISAVLPRGEVYKHI